MGIIVNFIQVRKKEKTTFLSLSLFYKHIHLLNRISVCKFPKRTEIIIMIGIIVDGIKIIVNYALNKTRMSEQEQ